MSLGTQIREARESAGLTMAALGLRAGFSKGYISQVERDLVTPSIGALNRIAAALNVRMRTFFTDAETPDGDAGNVSKQAGMSNRVQESVPAPVSVPDFPSAAVRHNRRKHLLYPESRIQFDLLTPNLLRSLEILMSTAAVGADSGDIPVSHVGEECVIVLRGGMELTVGGERFTLNSGDTLYFDAKLPHSWKSTGPDELQAIWVMTPPHF